MHCLILAGIIAAIPLAAAAEAPNVPSGQLLSPYQTLIPKDGEGLLYLSFVAPDLGAAEMSFDIASADMDALCASVGIPQAKESVSEIGEIVIRLFAQPIDYGTANPDVVQYLGAFDISTGQCEWL